LFFASPWSPLARFVAVIGALFLMLVSTDAAFAHKASDSYLRIRGGQQELVVQWDIAIKDLELLIGVDGNRDGEVTWGELLSKQQEIFSHAVARLEVMADGTTCELELVEMKFVEHSDGGYAVLVLDTGVSGDAQVLGIKYRLLFDLDPTHRGLVVFNNASATRTGVLSPDRSAIEIDIAQASLWSTFLEFTWEGVWHIWIGFDHILFLVCLLLPAVLTLDRKEGGERDWVPVDKFRPALISVLKIVTVFTIAHSITLWLAVMGYVTLPSQWVESAIAFSIIVTAANNLFPIFRFEGWTIAFVFGLIHGFGFANVLMDLGLSEMSLAISLFAFNFGVELGQIAIVAALFPLAFMFRKTRFYDLAILKLGSVLIAIIAFIWLIERIGNYEILGF
jgi:hypothetical protein